MRSVREVYALLAVKMSEEGTSPQRASCAAIRYRYGGVKIATPLGSCRVLMCRRQEMTDHQVEPRSVVGLEGPDRWGRQGRCDEEK